MTMTVTIVGTVYSEYGIKYPVGSQQSVSDTRGRDLVQSRMATDTNGVLLNDDVTAFSPYPIVISTSAPVNTDGRPDNTIYFQVSA